MKPGAFAIKIIMSLTQKYYVSGANNSKSASRSSLE
jgi:hypothetical protein